MADFQTDKEYETKRLRSDTKFESVRPQKRF